MRGRMLIFLACMLLIATSATRAELRFANIFNDDMVLQCDKPLRVWGWAEPGASVTVLVTEDRAEAVALAGEGALKREKQTNVKMPRAQLEYVEHNPPAFRTRKKQATVSQEGLWVAELEPMAASFTSKFLVAASRDEKVALRDLLAGEVWVTAGQSNMASGANRSKWVDQTSLAYTGVRYAMAGRGAWSRPKNDLPERAEWMTMADGNWHGVPTIPYIFGQSLHKMLLVPAGIINAVSDGADRPGTDVPKLDGVWRGFTVEGKGENPDQGPVHLELTIRGNHIDAKRLDGQRLPMSEGTYKITPGKPMQMDGTETNPRGRTRTYLGICELTGETLKWCVATPRNARPTEFETKRPQFLVILRRQKPSAP